MILLGKRKACGENMWFRLEKLRFHMEELRRSWKKARKNIRLGDFAPKNAKFIWFFDEKRFQRNPKLYATRGAFIGIHLGTIGLRQRKPGIEKV